MTKLREYTFYAVLFPHHTTLYYQSKYDIDGVAALLSNSSGLKTNSGSVYNPQQYISVSLCPDEMGLNKKLTRVLEDSMVG